MRSKILLISFVASLPFWVLVNILSKNIEDIFYFKNVQASRSSFTADLAGGLNITEEPQQNKTINLAENFNLSAKAAIAVKIIPNGQQEILFEKNASDILPIASLTKLMTAFVILDSNNDVYKKDKIIKVLSESDNQGANGILKKGEELSVKDLLYMMLIESSNDAAVALADAIGRENFVSLMNSEAKNLGMADTFFINPTGLEGEAAGNYSFSGNSSTAKDLANFLNLILNKYPEILNISSKDSYEVLNPDGSLHHFIPQNTNELLREGNDLGFEIVGGKTGFTNSAEGCLVLVLKDEKNNDYYLNVVLGSKDRFGDMKNLVSDIEKTSK